jgi:membrane-associated phospholipid phosphatase
LKINPYNFKTPRPADQVNIGYQFFIMITIIFHFYSVPNAGYFLLYHILIILVLLWLPNGRENKLIRWLKNFNPIIIIPTNFSELYYLVHNVNPVDFDQLLIDIDYSIFGVHPTVWLENLSAPIVVEYLQIIYASFYFLPIILVLIVYKKGNQQDFDFIVFVLVFGFYLSYATYFLIPAIGPRFTLDALQNEPITGLWFTESIRQILDLLENHQRDAFPSGHTEITVLTTIYAWKYSKIYFWILVTVGTSLIISTVLLRYHYIIDVFAGALLAAIIVSIAIPLYQLLKNNRFYPVSLENGGHNLAALQNHRRN